MPLHQHATRRTAAIDVRLTEMALSSAETRARVLLRLDELARERARFRSHALDRPRWAQLADAP